MPPGAFIDCRDTDPGDCSDAVIRDAQIAAMLDAELREVEASAPILWRGRPIMPSGLIWLGPALVASLALALIVYAAAWWMSRQ